MTKEKQINELRDLIMVGSRLDINSATAFAETLYRRGWRKQSEWISVDERLPHVSGKYICGVKDKKGNTWTVSADWSLEMKTWFGEFGEIKNIVTHWMPLPEPPKARKEDEGK